MKFRTKLLYCFISLALMSTLFALFIIFGEGSRLILKEVKGKILALVTDAEQLIKVADIKGVIKEKGNQASAVYQNLQQDLHKILQANRRKDLYVERIYIIQKYPDSEYYFFVIGNKKEENAFGDNFIFPGKAPKEIITPLVSLYGLIALVISIFLAIVFACFLSKLISSSLAILYEGVKKIEKGDFASRIVLKTRDEFNNLSLAINSMAKGLEERERLKTGFARYVSQYALEQLLRLDKPISLVGERKKVTLLFSDIREFTTLSEKLPPEEVLQLLNEYFQEMIEVIFSYNGTLDKFIGDGLMVEFGAPLEDKWQELHAVLAAIQMQFQLDTLSNKWKSEGKQPLKMGIGIHTGLAVLGNVGSERRTEYTAIGDTVNIAARLEQATKEVGKSILVSESVYEKTKAHFIFEDLHHLRLKGRTGEVQVYALDPYQQKNLHQIELTYEFRQLPQYSDE
ncbi:MAG: adenylate/guanylate cyclase domain-containing protein [Simkania negevensis]|nr:adenylate/guanylate cyclase domain-containing protein [Simkania negevensis]